MIHKRNVAVELKGQFGSRIVSHIAKELGLKRCKYQQVFEGFILEETWQNARIRFCDLLDTYAKAYHRDIKIFHISDYEEIVHFDEFQELFGWRYIAKVTIQKRGKALLFMAPKKTNA
jgi:hypothetical protein